MALRLHGMEEAGVRFSVGPLLRPAMRGYAVQAQKNTMSSLSLNTKTITRRLKKLNPAWRHINEHGIDMIERTCAFNDFPAAIDFVRSVADIAEKEEHHPDIHIHYTAVRIVLWTHSAKGLTENDCILAAKIDALKIA